MTITKIASEPIFDAVPHVMGGMWGGATAGCRFYLFFRLQPLPGGTGFSLQKGHSRRGE
jgi:hypothetical protein